MTDTSDNETDADAPVAIPDRDVAASTPTPTRPVRPFEWFGSKVSHFEFINSRLPRTHEYVEPFGGSAAILLNRDPVPVETINDLNDSVTTFFQVLRDRPEDLCAALRDTPYSRSEFARAHYHRQRGFRDIGPLEQARLFFVLCEQKRWHASWDGGPADWDVKRTGQSGGAGRKDGSTSAWHYRRKFLPAIADRLTDVQFDQRPALDVVEANNSESTTIYVDPPYPHDSMGSGQKYSHDYTTDDHERLALYLKHSDAYVAISCYDNDLYDALYRDWHKHTGPERTASHGDGTRQEVLWTNYNPADIGGTKLGNWPTPTHKHPLHD